MSSILCSQGMVLATAMAVSSTIVLLAFCSQKALSITRFSFEHNCGSTSQILRSCISSGARKRNKTKKKKRVHFALDVVEPTSNGEEFRRNSMSSCRSSRSSSTSVRYTATGQVCRQSKIYGLRENHMALYNGVLRDRGQRMVCLY